jgi:hypothetical protein
MLQVTLDVARFPVYNWVVMKRMSPRRRKDELFRLARRLEDDPCNRDGVDKAWVLQVLRNAERLAASARLLPRKHSGESVR